jgi:Spy/CpxP family protein refolding chaperone
MRLFKAVLGVAAIASVAGLALAFGPSPGAGYGYGPGMMGGYGPGMMGGYGPGMMGGYGPGMMGGYGSGMMGGRGPGMMYFGHGMQQVLGLSDEQRKKIDAIHDDLQAKNWEIMGKMRSEMAKMRELASAEPIDKTALDGAYKRINELRQQSFDAHIAARSQMEAVLTKEQKERFKGFGPWWLSEAD